MPEKQLEFDDFTPPEWKGVKKFLRAYQSARAKENAAKTRRQAAEFTLKEKVKDYVADKKLKHQVIRCDNVDLVVSESKETIKIVPVKKPKRADVPSKGEVRELGPR